MPIRRLTTSFGVAIVAAAASLSPAQAQQQGLLGLSCNGKWFTWTISSYDTQPPEKHPDHWGVTVNLSQRIVSFEGHTVPITAVDDARVSFEGPGMSKAAPEFGIQPEKITISGYIDRVVGDAVFKFIYDKKPGGAYSGITYELQCRPATRIF